jgi:hypothetical protein
MKEADVLRRLGCLQTVSDFYTADELATFKKKKKKPAKAKRRAKVGSAPSSPWTNGTRGGNLRLQRAGADGR